MAFSKVSLAEQLERYNTVEPNKHVQNKDQLLALQIAHKLDDKEHINWYMRLCKTVDEGILNRALTFVIDSNTDTKGKLFMWKVKQIRQELKEQGKLTTKKLEPKPKKTKRAKKVVAQSLFD
ncbi:MAG: hypothetical protein LBG64_03940 [Pseudomonadales bacterium]|jgi:hypothetical protein|nr:hypothetical protein [Pseudomonadales bacterium]